MTKAASRWITCSDSDRCRRVRPPRDAVQTRRGPHMAGTWIDMGGGMTGYLAVPAAGSGPGLVVQQEILALTAHIRDVADLYAEEGYVVLAPDLFHAMEQRVELGHEGADLEKAFDFYKRFDMEQAVADIVASVTTLRARAECTGK